MDETEGTSQIKVEARLAPRTMTEGLAVVFILGLLLFCAWPRTEAPLRYPDSFFYVHWPMASYGPGEPPIPSRRPPGYPLTLRLFGTGHLLMMGQTLFSLAGFSLMGWSLGRVLGVIVLGGLALAPALAPWNDAVLSESTSLACLAWLFFLSMEILKSRERSHQKGWMGEWVPPLQAKTIRLGALITLWGIIATYFALLRDTNGLILPLFGLCFLRLGKRWFALAVLFILTLGLGNALQADREGRYQVPYATALLTRTLTQPGELDRLRELGMPPYTMPVSEEMREWFDQGGRRIYESWVITRLDSYTAFIPFLHASHVGEFFRETYFARGYRPGPGEPIAEIIWWSLSLPFALFLSLLALPWIDYKIRGQVGVPAAIAALLVPITYMVGFVTYHGAGSEEYRHMLTALVLYRIAFIFAAGSLLTAAKTRIQAFRLDRPLLP